MERPPTARVGLFAKIGGFVDEYWPIILVAVSGAAMTLIQGLLPFPLAIPVGQSQWLKTLAALLILSVFVVGNVLVYRRNSRAQALGRENQALEKIIQGFGDDYFDIWRTKLGHAAKTLGLSDQERVSIYKHSDRHRLFYMLGRYSEGPDFARRGRGVYPEKEGCIGQAWQNGEGLAEELPDPDFEGAEYARKMSEDWNIGGDAVNRMAMKSRLMFAKAIRDRTELHRIAVVVFESTRIDGFLVEDVRKFVEGNQGREMAHLIEVLQSLEPSPEIAASRGF